MPDSQAPGYGRLEARREAAAHRDGIAHEQPQEPSRKRSVRQNHKTPEDIAQESQARKKKTSKYLSDLKDARATVSDAAKGLFAKYGSGRRTEGFYEREILQTARLGKTKRKLNSWNAYIRARLKVLNDGTSSPSHSVPTMLVLTCSSAAFRSQEAHLDLPRRR